MSNRILLTGAGGFVGSHVLRHILTNTDYDVVCPVTFRHRGKSDRIRLALDDIPDTEHRVAVIRCDLTAPISDVTDSLFGPIDYVLNVASESHVDRSITDPADFILNNVALICRVLDWARMRQDQGRGPEAIIQVSTDEVYGPAPRHHDHVEWVDGHLPSNPYSASKAAQEDIAFAYWRTYDLPVVITNTMNIIGETQDTEKFFPMVLKHALAGTPMPIHVSPEGTPGSRFYLHARNQADGLLFVLNHVIRNLGGHHADPLLPEPESLRHSQGGRMPYRFNIVGERELDNLTMARLIAAAAGRELNAQPVDFHSARPGHDLRYALDGTKLAKLGWTPPVPLEDSIQRTVNWTLSHREWLS